MPEQKLLPMPKAVIFDLLTALENSWTIWDDAVPSHEKNITGETWRKRYLDITYACGAYKPYESLVEQAAQQVGLSAEAPKRLLEHWSKITVWPEVPQVLDRLVEDGFKLGVVTNCSIELGYQAISNCEQAVRTGSKCKDFKFDAITTSEESGYYKPHPKPYEDVLKMLGVKAEDALFVAGSPADIPGAGGVGMRVVWHNHIGLARKNDLLPLREGATLDEALKNVVSVKID